MYSMFQHQQYGEHRVILFDRTGEGKGLSLNKIQQYLSRPELARPYESALSLPLPGIEMLLSSDGIPLIISVNHSLGWFCITLFRTLLPLLVLVFGGFTYLHGSTVTKLPSALLVHITTLYLLSLTVRDKMSLALIISLALTSIMFSFCAYSELFGRHLCRDEVVRGFFSEIAGRLLRKAE